MKHKSLIGVALIAAVGFVAFAAEKSATKERILRIQSDNGQVIAEIHLLAPCKFLCDATKSKLSVNEGTATYQATGHALNGTLLFNNGAVVVDIGGNVKFSGKLEDLEINSK